MRIVSVVSVVVSVVSVVVSVVRWKVSVGDSVVVACVSIVISCSLFNYVSSLNFFFFSPNLLLLFLRTNILFLRTFMGRSRTCTAKVVEIISESTYTVIYAPRIPTFLKLNAVRLNLLLVKQAVYVYCECHIIYFIQIFKRLSIVLSKVSLYKRPSIYSVGMDE